MTTYFAIREKGSDKFIPLPKKIGCGYTQVEVSDSEPPRLFTEPRKAQMALREWLKGYQYNEWNYDAYEGPFVKETPHRLKENMEIVEIRIQIL